MFLIVKFYKILQISKLNSNFQAPEIHVELKYLHYEFSPNLIFCYNEIYISKIVVI